MSVKTLASQYEQVIFHTHSFYPPLSVFLLTLFNKNRCWVITEHRLGESPAPYWKRMIRQALRLVKLSPKYVIAVSDAVKARNIALYGNHVTRIHNGIKLGLLETKKSLKAPINALYVGRLDVSKGIERLIEAFDILVNTFNYTKVTLTIVGSGDIFEKLMAMVKKKQLSDYIYFTDHQKNLEKYYRQSDFLIIPTIIKEACPLVVLEARSMGVPILYSNRGGLPETVGKAGKALAGLSPDEMAESIKGYCQDVDGHKQLSKFTHEGLKYFSMERMISEYVKFYLNIFR